ncbi:hypothetical protein KBD71_03830 [Candidatus Woesebacteria bacterium]|nr:hypothetical protein [Candidatus Woesebacteria bacterium]
MQDPIVILLVVIVVLLSMIIVSFLVVLTIVLLALKKTLVQLQVAIDNVEDTALRSLSPLLNLRSIVTDLGGFMSAVGSVSSLFTNKKRTKTLKDRND